MAFFGLRPNKNIRGRRFWVEDVPRILRLSKKYPYELVVLEISEISLTNQLDLIEVLQPTISVLTSLAKVHASDHAEDDITLQMQSLIEHSESVIYNADFSSLKVVVDNHPRVKSYGSARTADYRLIVAGVGIDQLSNFVIRHGMQDWDVPSNQIGQHSGVAYSAALAVTDVLGGDIPDAIAELKLLYPVRGRLNPLRGIRKSLIIDDCYNANAISMGAALDTLARFPAPRIAVLGSMNELGDHSPREHRAVGRRVAQSADVLIAIGEDSTRYLAPAAIQAGMKPDQVHTFESARAAGAYLKRHVAVSSTVMGKGSQDGVYTEEALLPLVVGRDKRRLIRQTAFWRAKKDRFYANLQTRPTE